MNINFYRLNKTQKYLKIFLYKNSLIDENNFLDNIASELAKNIDIIQVVNVDLTTSNYVDILKKIKLLCAEFNTIFIITDRCDISLFINSDGILIPENGLSTSFCRHLLGEEKMIGIEVSNEEQIENINSEIDYILLKSNKFEEKIKSFNIPYFIDTRPFQGNNSVYLNRTNP